MNCKLEIRLEPYESPLPSPYPSAKVYITRIQEDGSVHELPASSIMMNRDSVLTVILQEHDPAAVHLQRPECFEFAMDFLGAPEAPEVVAYVEALESRIGTRTP